MRPALVIALALAAAACARKPRRSEPSPTAGATPVDAAAAPRALGPDAAPPIDADLAALAEAAVTDPDARRHLALTLMRARGGGRASFRVLSNFEVSNAYSLVLEERIEDAAGCRVGPRVVELAKQDPTLTPVETHVIGHDCCPGTPCPSPTAMGAMLRFDAAIHARDLAALRRLVHPTVGLHIKITFSGSDDSDTSERTVQRARLQLGHLRDVTGFNWSHYQLECADFDAGGDAHCSAFAGGFGGSYDVHREGAEVFLTSLEEATH